MVRLEPTNASIVFVTKQIIRFPWSDPAKECGVLVVRIMMKACRKGRYKTIQAVAAVAAALRTQRAAGEATVRLIDAVLEELHWALEHPNFRDQQRTITYGRLLGELCCESQISAQTIFQQLYRFINLGHAIPQALRDASERLALGETSSQNAGEESKQQLPVFNSASGVSQTIQEDEEMEESELETTDEKTTAPEQQPVAVSRYSVYDPRVPSSVDPPTSVFRIKLVCTLLEAVAKSIVSRNSLARLKGFLAAFQRYLFTKTMLPTDVEFSLLDSFDIIDSHWRRVVKGSQRSAEGAEAKDTGFPRFSSWLEAHNATVAVEESEALLEIQKRASVAVVSSSSIGDMGESIDDDDATTSSMDEDAEDISLSYSARDSVTEGNEDEMELDAEDQREDDDYSQSGASEGEDDDESESEGASDEDDDLEEDDEEEFDEEAYMRQLEDEAFERELRRVTMDALEKGKNASRKQVADNMPSGSQIIKKKTTEGPKTTSTGAMPDFAMALSGKSGISFQLLKKGNKGKVEAKEFIVPIDTNLAVVATKQDDAAARERDEIKQRVLRYEQDSAIAEISGGNVYLEQEKLQVIRNRPLSMDDIDRNFGTSGGNLSGRTPPPVNPPSSSTGGRGPSPSTGRGSQTTGGRGGGGRGSAPSGGRGRGRGRGRSSSSGRGLF
jgi:regulator of nonsense transcripts 2